MAETAWFTYDDFADRVGQEFRLRLPEGDDLALVLTEVTAGTHPGGTGPDGVSRTQFSLLFRGPAEPVLAQGTWALDHETMGTLALFLVPIRPDVEGPRYEAAFA